MTEVTKEMKEAGAAVLRAAGVVDGAYDIAHEVLAQALAARPEPEGVEPVAWRIKDFADGWILCHSKADAEREAAGAGNLIQPLYAGPDVSRILTEIASLKARLAEAEAEKAAAKYPAEAVIEGDNIVIRVPISAIPVAFEAWPDAPRNDEADPLYSVTDAATFAKGIVRYLNDESEDGTTRIHLMLDSAMNEALEQGEEGVEEIAAILARGGSDD